MPQTPNHGYNVPNEGDPNWHQPLNENFEQYDSDIEIRDEDANKGNYEPKQGAKFLATDTETVYVGDGSSWTELPSTGRDPELDGLNPGGDNLGVGTTNPATPLDVAGKSNWDLDNNDGDLRIGDDNNRLSMGVALGGGGAGDAAIRAKDGNQLRLGAGGRRVLSVQADEGQKGTGNPVNFLGIGTDERLANEVLRVRGVDSNEANMVLDVESPDSASRTAVFFAMDGTREAQLLYDNDGYIALDNGNGLMEIDSNGDLNHQGGNKNFVQSVDTDDGEKEVVYTSTEAATPRTAASGVAELEDGRAAVELPDHFGWVTDDTEPIIIETTPYSADTGGLAVVERSTERLVVEDLEGDGDYEFAYTVRGTREGHADKQVIREPSTDPAEGPSPTPADD
jgi:hypothetical protein